MKLLGAHPVPFFGTGWIRKGSGRRRSQRLAAIRAAYKLGAHRLAALSASRQQRVPALRAEVEPLLHPFTALRTIPGQRLAQQEVRQEADTIRNEDDQQRPQYLPHVAALRVLIHVPDQQQVCRCRRSRSNTDQQPNWEDWRVGMMVRHDIQEEVQRAGESDNLQKLHELGYDGELVAKSGSRLGHSIPLRRSFM